jgi:predicted deacetylase
MQYGPEHKFAAPALKKRKRFVISIICLILLITLLPVGILKASSGNRVKPPVIIRVDDIQDYAFKDAQLFMLSLSITSRIPLSLAVIPGEFGEDEEIVETTKLAVAAGSEVAIHGWTHEDFSALPSENQTELLLKSKTRIKEILNLDSHIFIPPMYRFNGDTLVSMNTIGLNIISTFTDNLEPYLGPGTKSVPGTIQFSNYEDKTWENKSIESLKEEISGSISKYGFAIIVTHPQEFLTDDKLDRSKTEIYEDLLQEITDHYSSTTLGRLWENPALKMN